VDATLHDFRRSLHGEIFDFRDGVPGAASPIRPLPSAILAHDGRIWLTGTSGAAWIDPAHTYRNPVPPPVAVEAIVADGRRYDPAIPAKLPMLPSNVRIDFTALSLSMPERVEFRYWLVGHDTGWQESVTRRSAFYTNLKPGDYRFRVIACNNDGVWNESGASVAFTVPPAFFQTAWFEALCVAAGGAILWGVYLLRLRQVSAQMQSRIRERLGERERIARELHDTLLQGIQGMILRFQAAANQMPRNDPTRRMMEDTLDSADQVVTEGRERVRDLRSHSDALNQLPQALSSAGQELSGEGSAARFRLMVEGTPKELRQPMSDAAYRVAREALLNAFHHAQARQIEVILTYRRHELRLRVCDDGRGIDPQILGMGGRPDHWGLPGMRERSAKIGARFSVTSRPGAGTQVELTIPAAVAYQGGQNGRFWRWPWRTDTEEGD
jgi:signal transduction histidine kinase